MGDRRRSLVVEVRVLVRVDDGEALSRHVGADRPHPADDTLRAYVDAYALGYVPGTTVLSATASTVAATAVAPPPEPIATTIDRNGKDDPWTRTP